MEMPKYTLFYSNIRAGPDGEAGDDRQLLLQEQKACRARARQYSLETNRRRKALEDRKRQQNIKEQKMRENILQKRKQRLQEDTERFQRAHLPVSQRRSPASCTRVPNLDEALNHIQANHNSYTHQSSFFSGTSTISRSCSPSSKPPGGSSGPRSLRTVSEAQAFAKLIHERSLSDFKTSQLLFMNQLQENQVKAQEQLEQLQTQDHSDTQISSAESLSSLDSLENEVPQHRPGSKADSLDPPEVRDTRKPSLQRQQNYANPPSNPCSNPCPPKSFLKKVVSQQGLPSSSCSSSPSPVEDEISDEVQSLQPFLKAAEQYNITNQSQMSKIQSTLPCQMQVLAANSPHTDYQRVTTTQENVLSDKSTVAAHCKMQLASDTTPLEYLSMDQQSNSGGGEFSKFIKHQSEMQATQKANRCIYSSASDLNKVSQPVEAETYFQSVNEKYKTEHPNLTQENSNSSLKNDFLQSYSKLVEEPDETLVDTLTNRINLKSHKVQFLKGILKKCIAEGDAKFSYTPGHFAFSQQVAIDVKDSLELTRSKGRDTKNKCIKKELRWLDEVHIDEGENKEILTKKISTVAETKSRLTQQDKQPLVNQQQGSFCSRYMNIPADIPKNNVTSSDPGEPKSSKEAWSDVGYQKEMQQELTWEYRVEEASSCPAGLVCQQAHSAKSGTGTISSSARRGTIIRPQSSSQIQHVSKPQGKVLVPRPPPRPEVTTKTGNIDECSQDKACLAAEQVLYKDYSEGQPVPQSNIPETDEGNILAPVQHSNAYMYKTMSKGISLGQSDGQVGSSTNCFRKGILNRTPTDDEISQLWYGVRTALASKDGDSRSLQNHNGPLSGLPQKANGVKGVARMSGFFPASSNASPMRRPTMENNSLKTRTPALGNRKPPVRYQTTLPITASKTEQMVHDQDADEQVTLHSAHFQKAAQLLQSQRGLSALSLEEHKLLQSLDRLNHRLQYVQDVAARNTATKGIVALNPAYNQSPQPGERTRATLHRYRSSSADSRARPHRRY